MKLTHPFRLRLFASLFLLFGVFAGIGLSLDRLALRLAWPLWQLAAPALLPAALCSLVITLRLARQSRDLAGAMTSHSWQQAEQIARTLAGAPYAEIALEWRSALRTFHELLHAFQSDAHSHQSTLAQFLAMVGNAVDERVPYLRGHSGRVALYAAEIAREMKLDSAQVERIRIAALVHDIGNLGVEDAILSSSRPLTPEEFEIVKSHTVKGASILRPIEALHDLIPGIELHHESLDGAGYPYGLHDTEIPLMARIIAVADSFDAMTSARPYQAPMDPLYVLEVLSRLAGSRYDPAVVRALDTLVKRGTIVVRSLRAAPLLPRRRHPAEALQSAVALD